MFIPNSPCPIFKESSEIIPIWADFTKELTENDGYITDSFVAVISGDCEIGNKYFINKFSVSYILNGTVESIIEHSIITSRGDKFIKKITLGIK